MNAEYRCNPKDEVAKAVAQGRAEYLPHVEVSRLMRAYEYRLDKHIAEAKKGMPVACSRIAARVKMLLSHPALARTTVEVAG